MHAQPQKRPPLLRLFDEHACAEFDRIFKQFLAEHSLVCGGVDYTSPNTVIALRVAFDTFGRSIKPKEDGSRAVRASIRLYARLELYLKGKTDSNRYFYPTAALPCDTLMHTVADRWQNQWKPEGEMYAVVSSSCLIFFKV